MKGHATIELTDVNTGEVQKIEEDNLVTNAINYFCSSAGRLASVYLPSDPLYLEILGGIYLWDQQLEENVENVLPPATAGMVGVGARDISNSGTATQKMGSFNSIESGTLENGSVKMVWDFATNQANGEIACLTLTSKSGALVGYDYDEPNQYFNSAYNFVPSNCISLLEKTAYNPLLVNFKTDCLYDLESRNVLLDGNYENNYCTYTGKLKVNKYELGIRKYRLNRKSDFSDVKIEEIDVDLPQEIIDTYSKKNAYIYYNISDDNIYFVFSINTVINVDDVFHIVKMNMNFNIVNTYELKNTLGFRMYKNSKMWTSDIGYLFYSYNNKYYKINLNDYTDVSIINNVPDMSFYYEKNGRIYNLGYYNINSSINDNIKNTHLNAVKFKRELNNALGQYIIRCKVFGNPLFRWEYTKSGSSFYFSLCRDYCYLATINNLATPVTKTASQTMKITYTLTFDDETPPTT